MLPTALFIASILGIIVLGLLRSHPTAVVGTVEPVHATQTLGLLLLLRAFAAGCSALTGVEAIANATPSFRTPRRQRARRAEAGLGLVLGVLLIGLAVLIQRFDVRPVEGRTILSLVTEGSIGNGWLYLVIQLSTVLLLALRPAAPIPELRLRRQQQRQAQQGHLRIAWCGLGRGGR